MYQTSKKQIPVQELKQENIKRYIRALEGITFYELEEIKQHIDNTIAMSIRKQKRENALTIHENVLLSLSGTFGKFPVDLAHDYPRLPVLLDNNEKVEC